MADVAELIFFTGPMDCGKSTLALQVAGSLKCLYVSGEESPPQIRLRAERVRARTANIEISAATDAAEIAALLGEKKPGCAIIDSIQTLRSPGLPGAAGSPAQIRESAALLIGAAKNSSVPVILIGHITKDGLIAGPKALEHIVDTVLYFEGDRTRHLKILRAVKNRFGATHEIALLEMTASGLCGVENPSAALLADRPAGEPGSVIGVAIQGTRPLLFEIQALTSPSAFGMAKRMSVGLDRNRAQLLTAVLERAARLTLGDRDLFVNVVGGVEVEEPALDLPLCLAVASAYYTKPVGAEVAAFGEVGLAGEVRGVGSPGPRAAEAAALGFRRLLLPASDMERVGKVPKGLHLEPVATLAQAVEKLFP